MASGVGRWVVVAAVAVVVWVGSVVLAVTIADDDGVGQNAGGQGLQGVATGDDYQAEVTMCQTPREHQGGERAPAPVRTATGTITNNTDETRTFRVQASFVNANGLRVDQASAFVDELAAGQAARWETVSYSDAAAAEDITCEVGQVSFAQGAEDFVQMGTGQSGTGPRPQVPPVSYSTTENIDDGQDGDVGDIDAVTYVCYVVNPRVPITCGTVSN